MKIEPVRQSKVKPPDAIVAQVEPISVNLKQAAQLMGEVDPGTLRKWIDRADFPCIRIGGRIIIPVEKMRQWANDNAGKTIEL